MYKRGISAFLQTGRSVGEHIIWFVVVSINRTVLNINFKRYTTCISNYKLSYDLKKRLSNINNFVVHNIEENLNSCVLTTLNDGQVINPVYISDNKLFN